VCLLVVWVRETAEEERVSKGLFLSLLFLFIFPSLPPSFPPSLLPPSLPPYLQGRAHKHPPGCLAQSSPNQGGCSEKGGEGGREGGKEGKIGEILG